MKKIELFERAIAEQTGSLKEYGINGTMFWAYRKSLDAGNDLIDFNEVIWDEDIEAIDNCWGCIYEVSCKQFVKRSDVIFV